MRRSSGGRLGTANAYLFATGLLLTTSPLWAVERFDPATDCTSQDRGPYPWDFRQIVERHISETFFDPGSVTDLEVYKPAPGWWSTAALKMTRRNTKCYWYIAFQANGKNRMGGYVGRKAYGLWVRDGRIMYFEERTGVDGSVVTGGNRAFSAEIEKLDERAREAALQLSREEPDNAPTGSAPAYLQELRGLAALRDEGVITEEEFQAKKAKILGLNEAGAEPAPPPK